MSLKVYIGTDLCDINTENISSTFSVGDFKNLALGNLNKSFPIDMPPTKNNKAILKKFLSLSQTDEVTEKGRIFVNNILIIVGKVTVLKTTNTKISISISADDWADKFDEDKLSDFVLTAENYTFNATNVAASWSVADPFYVYGMLYMALPFGGTKDYLVAKDFLPMWRLFDLFTYLFAPFTIVSTFLDSAYFKSLFILAKELQAAPAFINSKGFLVANGIIPNPSVDINIPAGYSNNDDITVDGVNFATETSDEANCFVSPIYTVPETGTYRFLIHIFTNLIFNPTYLTIYGTKLDIELRSAAKGTIASLHLGSYSSGPDYLTNGDHELDCDYLTLDAGDTLKVYLYEWAEAHNTDSVDHILTMSYLDTCHWEATWSNKNLLFNTGLTVEPKLWMPDIKQSDFIRAIKEIFNLRFFVDRFKQIVYIEPADTFFTDNIIDLTSYQIYDTEPEVSELSVEYTKNLVLKWIEDSGELAVKEHLIASSVNYSKEIGLTSEYTKAGSTDMQNSVFAFTPTFKAFGLFTSESFLLPAIWGDKKGVAQSLPDVRNSMTWKPRIFKYDGLTSSPTTWYFEGVAKSTYPKVEQLDLTDIYNSYWLRTIHWLDKGKLATVYIRLPQFLLNQLMTVVNDSASEGFRAKYKFTIKGETAYGILNNIETDGIKAKCEFLIKK